MTDARRALPLPAVVVLVGPSGSGKTTWAHERFARGEVVSSDALRGVVGTGERDLEASVDAFAVLDAIVGRQGSPAADDRGGHARPGPGSAARLGRGRSTRPVCRRSLSASTPTRRRVDNATAPATCRCPPMCSTAQLRRNRRSRSCCGRVRPGACGGPGGTRGNVCPGRGGRAVGPARAAEWAPIRASGLALSVVRRPARLAHLGRRVRLTRPGSPASP